MNINKFTQSSMAAVQNLEKIAADYGNQEIEQEHLLYSLLTIDDSLILKLIEKMGITKETMMNRVEELLRKLSRCCSRYRSSWFHIRLGKSMR